MCGHGHKNECQEITGCSPSATEAESHKAFEKHAELSGQLSLHLQWRISPPSLRACRHPTSLLLFLKPTAAPLGKQMNCGCSFPRISFFKSHAGSTCPQGGWHSCPALNLMFSFAQLALDLWSQKQLLLVWVHTTPITHHLRNLVSKTAAGWSVGYNLSKNT